MSSSPDEDQAKRIPGSGLLLFLQEWASDHLDAVAHESPKREALERHQHPAYLIPGERSAVDHQQRDLSGAVRIPGDAADEMTCVRDPPAELPSLHVADGEFVLNSVVQHLEQVPHVGVEVAEDGELIALLSFRHALSCMQSVTRRHEHRSELEGMLDAIGVGDSDGLQRGVVEVDAHHRCRLLVEAPVAAEADVRDRNALV